MVVVRGGVSGGSVSGEGAHSTSPLGAIEHVLVSCHLPYCHDNLGTGAIPGIHRHRAQTALLISPEEGEGEEKEGEEEEGEEEEEEEE